MSRDWADDFKPVPPGPLEHFWRLSVREGHAECSRCGLQLRATLTQFQTGHAVSSETVLAETGVRYDPRKHGRCAG